MGLFKRADQPLGQPDGGVATDERAGRVRSSLESGDLDSAADQLLEWSEVSAFTVDGEAISAENDKGGIINLRRLAEALCDFLEERGAVANPSGTRLFGALVAIKGVPDAWQPPWDERFERINRTWG